MSGPTKAIGARADTRVFVPAAALCIALVAPSCTVAKTSDSPAQAQAQAPAAPPVAETDLALALHGKILRRAIDREYQVRKTNNTLHPSGRGINDFRDVVLQYIPQGMPFDDAVATLKAAGFTVGAREEAKWPPYLYRRGTIDHYDNIVVGRVMVSVFLVPRDKEDWSTVQNVVAQVTIDSL